MRIRPTQLLAYLSLLLFVHTSAAAQPAPDLQQMQQELRQLKAQLAEMARLKQQVQALETQIGQLKQSQAKSRPDASAQQEQPPKKKEKQLKLGGAIRFNYFYKNYDTAVKAKHGQSGLDLFRINADGSYRKLLFSAEYRWYPYMQTIHHGWIGYKFNDNSQLQAGITKVPFGLLPYAAHNYWFGVPYYVGLADNYDTGIKYLRTSGPWDLRLAFFKNGELGDSSNLDRYSFDVVSVGPGRNEQTNQFNARLAYTFGRDTSCSNEVGTSLLRGSLYNLDTGKNGSHWAAAAHLDSRCGRWNVQLEAARYHFSPRNPAGVSNRTVRLGAFATSYDVASAGTLGVFNVAYNLPVHWQSIDQITCYNDYSVLHKDASAFRKSQLNTTGCAIGIGPLFTYIDIIRANNMVFLGNGSLAGGGDQGWNTRFNINVGYYF
jgi:hypothetical protein